VRGEANALRPRAVWKRLAHGLLVRRYAACLAIGEANRAFYLAHGVPAECIFPAPYCVDNERFASSAQALRGARAAWRQAHGIPTAACVFVFCGRFVGMKRPLDLLQAFDVVFASGSAAAGSAHLLLAGDGEMKDTCRRFAEERRLPATFTGFMNQSEMPRVYAMADCLVLPSDDGETWGLVVNEAMACGLPAIVSDRVGCHLDLIVPGETGAVFPCGDTDALADRLRRLAADPVRRSAMGERARAHVARYNYAAAAQGTLAALRYVQRRRQT
jgi:glycosyltransferase involved in cell wall biosynthesis